MNAVRDAWTDERLDDLTARIEKDFRRVDERFMRVDRRFDRVDERFDQLNARFDALQQSIIVVGGGLFTAFLVALVGLVATQL